ncbi:MAG: hypothetical protein FWF77_09660 [Defluviitaleaceae bacterium]|nr:hypothetical protein [Defluviitaleaceae bacterium]
MLVISDEKERILIQDLIELAGEKMNNPDDFRGIVGGDYGEIVKVFGIEVAVRMYIHFRGCSLGFPKHFYRPEYVVSIASTCSNRRDREHIAMTCGYTSQWIERMVRESFKSE